jgi:hypothetical protein
MGGLQQFTTIVLLAHGIATIDSSVAPTSGLGGWGRDRGLLFG